MRSRQPILTEVILIPNLKQGVVPAFDVAVWPEPESTVANEFTADGTWCCRVRVSH